MAKKRRVKKIMMHRRPAPSKLEERMDDFEKRLGSVHELIKQVALKCAQEIGRLTAQLGVNIESIDVVDTNLLATALVLKEVFGQLTQVDDMLKLLDSKPEGKSLDQRVDETSVVERAQAWYSDIVNSSLTRVREEKAEHYRKQKEAAEEALKNKTEHLPTNVETEEKTRVENELKKAQSVDLSSSASAGPGSEHPEGAQVFGG
jgi:lysyl-tRNA synthetase class I